ncbi:hypothetical protein McanMca71_000412 [Microsporum canis]|uniref:Uncharacterized protein n=1 Tax=Arthroderma otae (strain ATCC MYA-4605 / CBS 113480) TaxID=554155 RepID=C5FK65_ARTOC|nr:conserved hypothetical protein [Microsporum canis CBS 113480]EEQ30087.1 conserved hypothetical protein [Microsporum canis CBS 113480]
MEPASSRETEPMSSTTLSRVRRTLTAPEPYLPQSSAHSMDELALPFPFEVAVPRYPSLHRNLAINHSSINIAAAQPSYVDTESLWEAPDDEPDMPPAAHRFIEPVEHILDGSGMLKAVAEDFEPDLDPISTIEEAPRSYGDIPPESESMQLIEPVLDPAVDVGNGPQSQDNIIRHGDEKVHVIQPVNPVLQPKYDSPPQSRTVNLIEPEEKPLKRVKNQKKKVKRGKTTSAVVQKRVESDVEDDVIWIDERKSTPAIIDDTDASDDVLGLDHRDELFNTSAPPHNVEPVVVIPQKTEVQGQMPPDATNKPDIQTNPAPKKRGRKRKKTSQEVISKHELPKHTGELKLDTSIEDGNCNIPLASPQPPSFTEEKVKHQTPEPIIGFHVLHETTKSPDISVDREAEPTHPIETPKKPANKGPNKHSPIAVTAKVAYRVGLSRKARIAPLLKVVRK